MKNAQKGFIGLVLIIVITIAIIAGGAYFYMKSLNSNPEKLNQVVAGKYNNSAGKRKVIKDDLINIVSTLKSEETGENYKNICDSAPAFLNAKAKERLADPDIASLNASLGIALESYRLGEYRCKAADDAFVLTIPFTAEDGSEATVCVNQYTFGVGTPHFDFENLTEDKLTCTWK